MPVLLISRGTMSGGQAIGECLERNGGFRCVTREHLTQAVNAQGELATKVTASIANAAHDYARFCALRRPYTVLMRQALIACIREGNVAYLGYSGHLLLAGVPGMLRARIIAPLEMRVRALMAHEHLEEDEAREHIRRVDAERAAWARFVYGQDSRSPEQYDLCLNMARCSTATACAMLAHAAAQPDFQPTAASETAIENLWLATCALAALVTDPRTHAIEMGATSTDGIVSLEGQYLEPEERALVMAIVRAVPDVRDVQYEPGYSPAFNVAF